MKGRRMGDAGSENVNRTFALHTFWGSGWKETQEMLSCGKVNDLCISMRSYNKL